MSISDAELELIAVREGDRVEFKESLSDGHKVKRAICAFANDLADHRAPGFVIIGVRDDGSCASLTITEELERQAANYRIDGTILPFPSLQVRRRTLRGCNVLVVEVEPSSAPPVRVSGVAYVRVGTTNQRATPEDERRLVERVQWSALPFDRRPLLSATLDDLDLEHFRDAYLPSAVAPDVLVANQRSREHQLAALRLATPSGQPTGAGVLVLGRDVRQWIPGAYVQFVRFDGTELTDAILDQKEISGRLLDVCRQLDEILDLNVRTPTRITGTLVEQRTPEYPLDALRQLTRNAIMHRTYEGTNSPTRVYWFSDRIEIHSPGGPYGQVNRQNFSKPGVTDYRNPTLAEAMKNLGLVQRFGLGFELARSALLKNGNPSLEFQIDEQNAFVAFFIRRRP